MMIRKAVNHLRYFAMTSNPVMIYAAALAVAVVAALTVYVSAFA